MKNNSAVQEENIDVLRERYLRVLAELQTLRKRLRIRIDEARREERKRILVEWLAVVDNIERALAMQDGAQDSWLEGMRAIQQQALAVLEAFGVEPYRPEGEEFDPHLHEAVQIVRDSSVPNGVIAQVVQTGYMMDGEVLRAAKVVVAQH